MMQQGPRPFIAAISEPVQIHVPGLLHPSGVDTWVSYDDLSAQVYERGGMGLTFEGPTII